MLVAGREIVAACVGHQSTAQHTHQEMITRRGPAVLLTGFGRTYSKQIILLQREVRLDTATAVGYFVQGGAKFAVCIS